MFSLFNSSLALSVELHKTNFFGWSVVLFGRAAVIPSRTFVTAPAQLQSSLFALSYSSSFLNRHPADRVDGVGSRANTPLFTPELQSIRRTRLQNQILKKSFPLRPPRHGQFTHAIKT